MKNLIRLFCLSCFLSLSFTGCYYDKEDMVYPCNLSKVTYKETIAPIMAQNCNMCHYTGATNAGGWVTDNYTDLSLIATPDGPFWNGINWISGTPMPKGGAKLSPCDLGKIKKWISDGALNN